MFFTVTAEYLKPVEDEEGLKKVIEKYLVNAMTVTEAEAIVTKWFPDNYKDLFVSASGIFDLDSVLVVGDSDQYYLARIKYSEETKKGKLKWFSYQVLVNGDDIKKALNTLEEEHVKDSMRDGVIAKIEESKIIVDDDLVTNKNDSTQ